MYLTLLVIAGLVFFLLYGLPYLSEPRLSKSQQQWQEFSQDAPQGYPLEVVSHGYRMIRAYRREAPASARGPSRNIHIVEWEWKIAVKNKTNRDMEIFANYYLVDRDHLMVDVDSAILQDPGAGNCNSFSRDAIRSSGIKAATYGTFYNLVIMSTCKLGSSASTMPGAFQIEKIKSSTEREFYLGYVYLTYDSAAFRFEKAMWSYLNGAPNHQRTLYQAFTYAASIGGYPVPNSANPFQANWWGNPNYNGTPGWA